jgi:hypothetical protein
LHIEVHRRGKPDAGFTIELEAAAKALRRERILDPGRVAAAGDDGCSEAAHPARHGGGELE